MYAFSFTVPPNAAVKRAVDGALKLALRPSGTYVENGALKPAGALTSVEVSSSGIPSIITVSSRVSGRSPRSGCCAVSAGGAGAGVSGGAGSPSSRGGTPLSSRAPQAAVISSTERAKYRDRLCTESSSLLVRPAGDARTAPAWYG